MNRLSRETKVALARFSMPTHSQAIKSVIQHVEPFRALNVGSQANAALSALPLTTGQKLSRARRDAYQEMTGRPKYREVRRLLSVRALLNAGNHEHPATRFLIGDARRIGAFAQSKAEAVNALIRHHMDHIQRSLLMRNTLGVTSRTAPLHQAECAIL